MFVCRHKKSLEPILHIFSLNCLDRRNIRLLILGNNHIKARFKKKKKSTIRLNFCQRSWLQARILEYTEVWKFEIFG